MTDKYCERAAQIWCEPYMASKEMDAALCFLIGAALREAVEEMQEDRDRWADSACRLEKAQEKIKAEAYEDSAKIVRSFDLHPRDTRELCIARIRAQAQELK